jgi:hypothetical protein
MAMGAPSSQQTNFPPGLGLSQPSSSTDSTVDAAPLPSSSSTSQSNSPYAETKHPYQSNLPKQVQSVRPQERKSLLPPGTHPLPLFESKSPSSSSSTTAKMDTDSDESGSVATKVAEAVMLDPTDSDRDSSSQQQQQASMSDVPDTAARFPDVKARNEAYMDKRFHHFALPWTQHQKFSLARFGLPSF